MFDDSKPIFLQLAGRIADDILQGTYPEGVQVPSTNEFAAFYRINPATAGKGVNLLVDQEILYKKRGIGMFVADGAKQKIAAERQSGFVTDFVQPLLAESRALQLALPHTLALIEQEATR